MKKTNTRAANVAASAKTTVRSRDFEAPLTITVSGPLAAVLRFRAYLDEAKPEDVAVQAVATAMVGDLTSGFGVTDEGAEKLLGSED